MLHIGGYFITGQTMGGATGSLKIGALKPIPGTSAPRGDGARDLSLEIPPRYPSHHRSISYRRYLQTFRSHRDGNGNDERLSVFRFSR